MVREEISATTQLPRMANSHWRVSKEANSADSSKQAAATCRTSGVLPRLIGWNRSIQIQQLIFSRTTTRTIKGRGPEFGLFPQESDRSRKIPRASSRQKADGLFAAMNKPINEGWTTGDISGYGFALTLVLSGTILSAYSDRPVFWLLVGPGPLVMGLTLIAFLRYKR